MFYKADKCSVYDGEATLTALQLFHRDCAIHLSKTNISIFKKNTFCTYKVKINMCTLLWTHIYVRESQGVTFCISALQTSCSLSVVMSRGTSNGEPRISPFSSWNWINSRSTSSFIIRFKSTTWHTVYYYIAYFMMIYMIDFVLAKIQTELL